MTLPTPGPAAGPAMGERIAESQRRHAEALEGAVRRRWTSTARSGRPPVRERITLLLDEGSWFEPGRWPSPNCGREGVPAGGVITDFARLNGRNVRLSLVATRLSRHHRPDQHAQAGPVIEQAAAVRAPAGAAERRRRRTYPERDGLALLRAAVGLHHVPQSAPRTGAVPRVAAVVGPTYGDAALRAAIGNFVVMVGDAAVALSGPPVIRGAIGEEISAGELGGPAVAAEQSGSVHMIVEDEDAAFAAVKQTSSPTCQRTRPPCPRR